MEKEIKSYNELLSDYTNLIVDFCDFNTTQEEKEKINKKISYLKRAILKDLSLYKLSNISDEELFYEILSIEQENGGSEYELEELKSEYLKRLKNKYEKFIDRKSIQNIINEWLVDFDGDYEYSRANCLDEIIKKFNFNIKNKNGKRRNGKF